jgi:hypothetical protein
MTDELTPEEKDAFDKLPRERMPAGLPAGLEERVVSAMREHGYLVKRRRVVELTGGRMAGVLAASVALVIGAYSIGLHRGSGVLPPAATLQRDDRAPSETPIETRAPASKPMDEVATTPAPTKSEGTLAESYEKKSDATDVPAALPEEADAGRSAQPEAAEGLALKAREPVRSPTPAAPQSLGKLNQPVDRAQTPATAAPSPALKGQTTFLLNGSVVVEVPDSVRVIPDELGKMLIIHTSDGIIRIYLLPEER